MSSRGQNISGISTEENDMKDCCKIEGSELFPLKYSISRRYNDRKIDTLNSVKI